MVFQSGLTPSAPGRPWDVLGNFWDFLGVPGATRGCLEGLSVDIPVKKHISSDYGSVHKLFILSDN